MSRTSSTTHLTTHDTLGVHIADDGHAVFVRFGDTATIIASDDFGWPAERLVAELRRLADLVEWRVAGGIDEVGTFRTTAHDADEQNLAAVKMAMGERRGICLAEHNLGYRCTKPYQHDGHHEAHGLNDELYAQWSYEAVAS